MIILKFFQLCPDQPCGSATDVGSGVTLPTTAANSDNPCVAFSIGVDANDAQAIPAINCKGDLIRINGKYS